MKQAGITLNWFWFFLLCFLIICFTRTYPASSVDSSFMSLVESLMERKVFWTDHSPYSNPYDMAFFNGHYYSGKQPLLSLCTAAMLFPAHLWLKFSSPAGQAAMYYLASITSSGAAAVILFVLLGKTFTLVGADEKIAAWVTGFIFFGSIVLAMSTVYHTPVVEAALLFAVFYNLLKYRLKPSDRSPALCGLLIGFSTLLHLFAGAIFGALTAVYFLAGRAKDLFRYLLYLTLVLVLGAALNQMEHGNPKPFYMMTETYLFKGSPNLLYPTLINLSEERILRRLDDLHLSEAQKIVTLSAFRKYQREVMSVFQFAKENFLSRDFLCFTPVFFAGVFSILLCLFKKNFRFKREALWVLAGALISYVGLMATRNNPGYSFGSRYLVPQITLVTFFTVFYFEEKRNLDFFKMAFWPAAAMMVPGVFAPLRIPKPIYLEWNLVLNTVILGLHLLSYGMPVIARKAGDLFGFFEKKPWLAGIALALLFRLEMACFIGNSIF